MNEMDSSIQRQSRWLVTDMEAYRRIRRTHAEKLAQQASILKDWFTRRGEGDPLHYVRHRQVMSTRGEFREIVITVKAAHSASGRDTGHIRTSAQAHDFFRVLGNPDTIKRRYRYDSGVGTISGQCTLTIDEYMKPEGLVIIEWTDPPANAYNQLPEWMRSLGLVDVTLSLTAAHIANLPPLDSTTDPLPYLRHQIGPRIPVVVVTGGPVAGKSTILEKLAQDPSLLVVSEAATILIKQLGINPYGPDGHSERFQMALRRTQMTFEALACSQARAMGKKGVVVDRGTLDSCAYIQGGRNGFNQYFGFDALNEEQRYHAVVQLAVPCKSIYDKHRGDNSARPADETYDKALLISKALQQAWGKHPRYLFVDDTDWNAKQRRVIEFMNTQIE